MPKKKLFTEDECLRNDPTYPGIAGWWAHKFPGRSFLPDWEAASDTEVDCGDHFIRTVIVDGAAFEVTSSYDGYSVRGK